MKKMMITLAAVALAMGAQAAAMSWSVSTGVEGPYEGFTAYCYLGNNAGSELWGAVALATAAEAAKAGSIATGYHATMTLDDFGDGLGDFQVSDTAWGTDTTISAYAILFNSSDVGSATQYMVLGPNDVTFGDSADEQLAQLDVGTWQDIGGSPEPVPEPTSGLLLLLGVAGLALRRKQK